MDLDDETHKKRIVVTVADSVYYSFCSNGINKRTKKDRGSVYRPFNREISKELDAQITFKRLSKMDSIILSSSNKILNSLRWYSFKRWKGASAFRIEVVRYHGFPKNGTFEPS